MIYFKKQIQHQSSIRGNDFSYLSLTALVLVLFHGLAPLDDSPVRGQEPGRVLVRIQPKPLHYLLLQTKKSKS